MSEDINVNNPFSTSPFMVGLPPPMAPLPFCKEECEYVATRTDDDTSLAGKGASSSKWLKTLHKNTHVQKTRKK